MEKDMAAQETKLSLTRSDTSAPNSDQETKLTYRQNRRLQQATRAATTKGETLNVANIKACH